MLLFSREVWETFAFPKHTEKLASEVPKCKTEISFKVCTAEHENLKRLQTCAPSLAAGTHTCTHLRLSPFLEDAEAIRGKGLQQHPDGAVQVYSAALQGQAEIPACLISAMFPTPQCSQLPVSPGMYRSSYKRDYQWCDEYQPLNEEDMQKLQIADAQLKAKEFAVPQEKQAMTYSASAVWQGREVIPAPSIKASSCADDAGGRKAKGSISSPKTLQQRKRFTSVLPVAESYLPKYYPATELAAIQAETLERPRALVEPENELSYCQRLPAAAQTAGTAGMFLHRQKLFPVWATYQQFIRETSQARQHDAQQNRNTTLSSSALLEECFDLDWRSTYDTDFQHWPGAHSGYCRPNESLSHIFPGDEHLNQNRWVSEYKDNYSIFLQRLNRSSQIPAEALCSGMSFGKGVAMHTAL